MSDDQKCRYLHNIFREETLPYYKTNVQNQAMSYEDAKCIMLFPLQLSRYTYQGEERTSNTKVQRIHTKITNKRKSSFFIGITHLQKVHKCPAAYIDELHRVKLIKQAQLKEEWANTIILEVNKTTNFQQLYKKS